MFHTITMKVSFSDNGMTADDLQRMLDAIADAGAALCEELEKDSDLASVWVSRPRATEAQLAKLAYIGVSRP